MKLFLAVFAIFTLMGAANGANAATYLVQTQTVAQGSAIDLGNARSDDGEIIRSQTAPSSIEGSSLAQSTILQEFPGSISLNIPPVRVTSGDALAEASADIETGVLRVGASQSQQRLPSFQNTQVTVGASASAFASISETFFITGTGTFTALFAVDASYQIFDDQSFAYQASIAFPSFGGGETFFLDETDTVGAFDDMIISASRSFTNANSQRFDVTWSLLAQVGGLDRQSSSAFVNSLNSGSIFFEGGEGLTITSSDPNFLSSSVYLDDINNVEPRVTPVPLPAGFPMLLSALLLAGHLRRAA